MSRGQVEQPTHRPVNEPDGAELEALLSRCAAGVRAALEILYTRVAPILLAVLMRILRRRDAAEMLGTGALLLRCLEQIAAPQRRCLMLAYHEGLTHSEIARAVNEPLGTVKSWVRRSLLALRRCLEP